MEGGWASALGQGPLSSRPGCDDLQQVHDSCHSGKCAEGLPGPGLRGLRADLTGQQFPWTDPQTTPIDVTLSHAAVSWLSFTDATVAGALDGAELAVHAPRNPRLFANAAPSPGLLLATNTITDITLTVDQATFGTALPSATVTLNAQAPAVLSNFEDTPVHYNMQVTQHWQAGARPAYRR